MAAPHAEPTGALTLREALATALTNSPELAAFAWEVRAREAEALQAGLVPNPALDLELEGFGGTGGRAGFDGAEATAVLSQLVELGGTRGKRRAVADHARHLAEWDYEDARLDVLTETAKGFVVVLAAQEQLALSEELVGVAEGVLASVSRRVEAGSTSPVEEGRARVELETSRIEMADARRTLTAARTRLAARWGTTAPAFTEAVGDLESAPPPPTLDTLRVRVAQNPALARWETELGSRRADLRLARARAVPSVTLGAGVRHARDIDDTSFLVGLGIPLPVFDRNQGATRAAELRLRRAEDERRAARTRVDEALTVAHTALLAADAEVRALRERAVPEAERTFEAAREAYRRGSMRLTDVLDTERSLFELRSRYVDALARYHTTLADLERLVAEPLGRTP